MTYRIAGSRLPLLFLVLLVIALLLAPAAAAKSLSGNQLEDLFLSEQVMASQVSEAEQQQARSIWTRERMRAAKPLPFPATVAGQPDGRQPLPVGPMERRHGGLADPGAAALAQALYPEDWPPTLGSTTKLFEPVLDPLLAQEPYGYLYPPPFTFYRSDTGHMWTYYPWKTMGKLFFTVPSAPGSKDVTYSYCTASVAVGRALWTAGHCVYTPGSGWHTNMTFVPAYRNGNRPFGTFTAFTMASLGGWTSTGNQAYDIGMVAVSDNEGFTVAQWVGWLGAQWNASTKQHWHSNGYPTEFASGEVLFCCEGSISTRWSKPGPDPVGMGCKMRWGSSGGPWLTRFVAYLSGAKNYVNSVVSGSPDPSNNQEYFGPYFGGGAKNLYDWGVAR